MKHILTLSLCLLALSLSAQTDGWEYPFPYNPDGDADGYVTLSDLLDLLALYGNEYPDSFHYDDSGAILYLGQLSGHDCYNQARAAEGNWRVLNTRDIMKWGDYLLDEFDQYDLQVNPNSYARYYSIWCYDNTEDGLMLNVEYVKVNANNPGTIRHNGSNPNLVFRQSMIDEASYYDDDHCYIVTEVRAEIDYQCISGEWNNFVSESQSLISQGYFPIGGQSNLFSFFRQCFWKYADE